MGAGGARAVSETRGATPPVQELTPTTLSFCSSDAIAASPAAESTHTRGGLDSMGGGGDGKGHTAE